MKRCPLCAEEIQDAAIKCRFCGGLLGEAGGSPRPSPAFSPVPVASGVPLGLAESLHMEFGPGMVLSGRYEVREFLGRGAMGEVYAAHDRKLQREVALKVLPRELARDARWQAVYQREARHALELSHHNLTRVFDLQEDRSLKATFLVMERLHGFPLDAVLTERGALPWEEARWVVLETSRGLAHIHEKGLLHGDLKPANLFLSGLEEPGQALTSKRVTVKVMDFGLSVDLLNNQSRPRAASRSGTLLYLAPERLTLGAEVTGKADLYALGVILYELLMGKPPFQGPPELVIHHHKHDAPPRPAPARCPEEAWELIQALIAKDPEMRPASVEGFFNSKTKGVVEDISPETRDLGSKAQADVARHGGAGAKRSEETGVGAKAPHRPGDTMVNPNDGLTYIYIPPGTFKMGAVPGDVGAQGDEKPRHTVTITKGFWLCRTPVTVGAHKKFCAATRRAMPKAPTFNEQRGVLKQAVPWPHDEHPIVNVSWDDAVAYCEWVGGRLATEAEWEYAARAGTATMYFWGNGMDGSYAWYNGNSGGKTHPVGEKWPNEWGLYDMAGNVWEWCSDWYDETYYNSSPSQDPQGPESGQYLVLRGGSWFGTPFALRVSNRLKYSPGTRRGNLGFRSVLPTQ